MGKKDSAELAKVNTNMNFLITRLDMNRLEFSFVSKLMMKVAMVSMATSIRGRIMMLPTSRETPTAMATMATTMAAPLPHLMMNENHPS